MELRLLNGLVNLVQFIFPALLIAWADRRNIANRARHDLSQQS
jgi:hypothetical protein